MGETGWWHERPTLHRKNALRMVRLRHHAPGEHNIIVAWSLPPALGMHTHRRARMRHKDRDEHTFRALLMKLNSNCTPKGHCFRTLWVKLHYNCTPEVHFSYTFYETSLKLYLGCALRASVYFVQLLRNLPGHLKYNFRETSPKMY